MTVCLWETTRDGFASGKRISMVPFAVMIIFQKSPLVTAVYRKRNRRYSQAREAASEPVVSSEGTGVSPSFAVKESEK